MKQTLIYLFSKIYRYKFPFIAFLVFASASSVLTIKWITTFADGLDQLIEGNPDNSLELFIKSSIYFVSYGILGAIGNEFLYKVRMKIQVESVNDFFKHTLRLNYRYHTNKITGKLIAIITKGEGAYLTIFDNFLAQTVATVIQSFMIFQIMNTISTKYLIIMGLNVIIYFVIQNLILKVNIRLVKKGLEISNEWSGKIVDTLTSIENVKIFTSENFELKDITKPLDKYYKAWRKVHHSYTAIGVSKTLVEAPTLLILGYFLYLDYVAGTITAGAILITYSFFERLNVIKRLFNSQVRRIVRAYPQFKMFVDHLHEDQVIKEPATPKNFPKRFTPNISIKDLSFRYEDSLPMVFKDFNLDIKENTSIAIVGDSGGGKSTLVKLLFRFYDINSGLIKISDTDITQVLTKDLRKKIGLVPQDPVLFNRSIMYNLKYANPKAMKTEIIKACKKAKIYKFIQSTTDGFNTIVGERGIKLSGGQKQRIAIARVLIENPPIVIFDEATSSLDAKTEDQVKTAFENLRKDRTTIVIAHRFATIKDVDRIIYLEDGQIVEDGTFGSLSKIKEGKFRKLYELQKLN